MVQPKVFLYVDNSNIFISAKTVAERREGRAARDAVRLQFGNLLELALAGRPMAQAYVVGSIPPEQRAVWDRFTAATGVVPELYERGKFSGGEQGLDQCLQVHMLRASCDNPDPQIVVLMTGDGAGYDDGVGFHADMARMQADGWAVEVLSWEASCRRTLREWAAANGCFVKLDDHYDSITFLESGRRSVPVDLSARPMARPRLSPSQQSAESIRAANEKQIQEMQQEIDELKAKRAGTKKGQKKYERRMARQKAKKR